MLEKIPVKTAGRKWSVSGNRPAKNVANHWKTRGGNTAQTA